MRIDYGRTEHKAMANDRLQLVGDGAWAGPQNLDFPANQFDVQRLLSPVFARDIEFVVRHSELNLHSGA